MKNIFYIIIGIVLPLLSSCRDYDVNEDLSCKSNMANVPTEGISKNSALEFVNQISSNLFQSSSKTRAVEENRTIKTVNPIVEDSDTLLWIINYEDNKGYIVLSAKKQVFPILAFNNTGNFDCEDIHNNDWLKGKINSLKMTVDAENEAMSYAGLWDDDSVLKDGETITTEFEINTDSVINAVSRSIPERENPIGRQMIFPLCYPVNWGTGFGYHYEMPVSYRYESTNEKCKLPVNELVVSVCHLMSHYWVPYKYGWMYMPSEIKQVQENDKSNLVASMFKDVSTELGVKYDMVWGCTLPPSTFMKLPSFFANNDYSNTGEIIPYNFDENSFLKVYNCLQRYQPVLFAAIKQPKGANRNWVVDDSQDRLDNTWVVDGYQEVQVKVTKKKYFLGIKVSEKVHYYYSDFFRFLYAINGTFSIYRDIVGHGGTGWFQQDHKQLDMPYFPDTRTYAIINICP